MSKTRVAIVGAGALGLSSALHLAQSAEFEVTVLEAGHIAEGSSSRSIGIIETQYMNEFDIAVRAFGLRFARKLAADEGLHFVTNGYLRLAADESALERYAASIAIQRHHGVDDARVLTRDEVKSLIPQMQVDDRVGGLFGPSDGFVDGHLYTNLLGDLARKRGVTILQRAKLFGADHRADGTITLNTSRGIIEADRVVNAAGGWAGQVGDLLDAPVVLNPQRHQAITITLDKPLGYVMPSVMDYAPGSGRSGLYFRHENDTKLFAGLHTEETLHTAADPDNVSWNVDADFTEEIAEALAERLPNLGGAGLGQGWAGLYPMSFDQQPVVGPHPTNPAVICALGAGGNGIQLSPAIGHTVAQYLAGAVPTLAGTGSPWDSARITSHTPITEGATR